MESNNNKYSDEKSHIVSVLLTSALLSALTASSYFHKFPEKSPFNKENNIELPDSSNSGSNSNQFIIDQTKGSIKKQIIQRETSLVNSWFKDSDGIVIPTNNGNLSIKKSDLQNDIETYKGEDYFYGQKRDNLGNKTGEMIELDSAIANRNQLQNFIASSEPVLKKVVESFALDQGDYRTKIKKINNLLNWVPGERMQYNLDTITFDNKLDTIQIRRKPGIGIINGLLPNGIQGDCEDFSTNFIALAQTAGIPEDYLYIIQRPRHMLIGVRVPGNSLPETIQSSSCFFDPEGNMVLPIEVTTNGNGSGEPIYPNLDIKNIENVRSKNHSRGFQPSEITGLL